MPNNLSTSEFHRKFLDFCESNNFGALRTEELLDEDLKVLQLHIVEQDVKIDDFLSFSKLVGIEYFTYELWVLDQISLDTLTERTDVEDRDDIEDESNGEEEDSLPPAAMDIVLKSVERQAGELSVHVGEIGAMTIWAHKGNAVFKLDSAEDWYQRFQQLDSIFENAEENAREFLNEVELKKFDKEMEGVESTEDKRARQDDEIESSKEEFIIKLSKDKVFLNGKNQSLRMIRAGKLKPKELAYRIPTNVAVDMAIALLVENVNELREKGKSVTEIADIYGIAEKVLRKHVELD